MLTLATTNILDLQNIQIHQFIRQGRSENQLQNDLTESDTRVVYVYEDDYEDYDSDYYEKNYKKKKKHKKKDNFLVKEAAFSSKVNTLFNMLILAGIILLPMAIAAELNLEAISAQIRAVQDSLNEYYVNLINGINDLAITLADITTSLTNLGTQVTGLATTLQTIITLINNLPRRRALEDNEEELVMTLIEKPAQEKNEDLWYILNINGNNSFSDKMVFEVITKDAKNSKRRSETLRLCAKEAMDKQLLKGIICSVKSSP